MLSVAKYLRTYSGTMANRSCLLGGHRFVAATCKWRSNFNENTSNVTRLCTTMQRGVVRMGLCSKVRHKERREPRGRRATIVFDFCRVCAIPPLQKACTASRRISSHHFRTQRSRTEPTSKRVLGCLNSISRVNGLEACRRYVRDHVPLTSSSSLTGT